MAEHNTENLVWIDMEMSGLDPLKNKVLEAAAIITDKNLNVLAESVSPWIVRQTSQLLESMDQWNTTHHKKSGLWDACLESEHSVSEIEAMVLDFIKPYTVEGKNILCGNSIAQDRAFMAHHMPNLSSYLHYRMIDVSSVKEIVTRWYPEGPKAPEKNNNHRALDDIRESIEELRFYRGHYFTKQ